MHCKSLWIKASAKCVNVMDKCCVCGKQPWIRSGLQMLPVWKHNESVLLLHIIRNAHRLHTHCRRSIIINILQFLLLCFNEDIDSFRWTSQWTDDDRIFIFMWTLKILLENVAAPAMFKSSLIWRLTWRLMKIWFCLQYHYHWSGSHDATDCLSGIFWQVIIVFTSGCRQCLETRAKTTNTFLMPLFLSTCTQFQAIIS